MVARKRSDGSGEAEVRGLLCAGADEHPSTYDAFDTKVEGYDKLEDIQCICG